MEPNFKLIDKFWPRTEEPYEKRVPARKSGECSGCGKCCALIRIGQDFEYFLETARHWIDHWKENELEPDPMIVKRIEDGFFVIKHWVRVDRYEAFKRKLVECVESSDFIYTCKLLTDDGKCSIHSKGTKPHVCSGYPFYGAKNSKDVKVFKGCGFEDRRYRKHKK